MQTNSSWQTQSTNVAFNAARWLSMCWLIVALCGIVAFSANAQEGNYTVNNVETYAKSDNATAARAEALEKAEMEAFTKLLGRLSIPENSRYYTMPPEEISRMVSGYDVVSEQVSPTSYRATLNVNFDAAQVQALTGFLNQYGSQYGGEQYGADPYGSVHPAERYSGGVTSNRSPFGQRSAENGYQQMRQPPVGHADHRMMQRTAPPFQPGAQPEGANANGVPVLVVPVLEIDGMRHLWEGNQSWRMAWEPQLDRHAQLRLMLPIGDLGDMTTVDADKAADADSAALSSLQSRYNANEVVVAKALVQRLNSVTRVEITLSPASANSALAPVEFSLASSEDETSLLARAAAEAINRLQPKAEMEQAATPDFSMPMETKRIKVVAPLAGLADWVKIRARLEKVTMVKGIQVVAVTPRQADFTMDFVGPIAYVIRAATQAGLSMTEYDGYWVVRRGPGAM